MELGRIGIWTNTLDLLPARAAADAAAELESLGYAALWFPEAARREAIANAALLLGATSRMVVATGIANIYARGPMAMANAARTLAEAYPARFLLGIGVSHQPAVEGMRGMTYGPPLATMRTYLDAMDAAPYQAAPPPEGEPVRVLAALGPKMLDLARDRTSGAHPYFVPPEHTAAARSHLGPGRLLLPEQAVVLETDPTRAREIARRHMAGYLKLPNYTNNLRRLGFGDADLADGGSDRLVDAIVAWGTLDDAAARVRAHHEAGADHVCVQALEADAVAPPRRSWQELASALL